MLHVQNAYLLHILRITCTECISAPYLTHVPAQISNSCDSAVVYITYLLSYV